MRQIRDELNETVYIAVRVGDDRINLDQLEGIRDFRRVVTLGKLSPLYVGSTSHVILAALPDEEVAAYIDRAEFVPPFPGAKIDAPTLRRAIAEVRRNGYAETHNKHLDEAGRFGGGAQFRGRDHGGADRLDPDRPLYRPGPRTHDRSGDDHGSGLIGTVGRQLTARSKGHSTRPFMPGCRMADAGENCQSALSLREAIADICVSEPTGCERPRAAARQG